MGYHRNLYIGPILRLTPPSIVQKVFYTYFDEVAENFLREDSFQVLQRHVGGCHKIETWVRPSESDCEYPGMDSAYALGEIDVEKEKREMVEKFSKEIDIIKSHYTNVVVDWGIVMDGS